MNTLIHIFTFEWKSLWRSNLLKVLLLVVLGAGIYGIFFGKFEIDKQEVRTLQVQEAERQQFDSLLVWAKLDTQVEAYKEKYQQAVSPTGVGWNKHFTYYKAHKAPPLAGLCLGQRDLYPVYYGFNVTDLARQMNVGELANPMKLLTGNFDLSYVLVFLFPLLIVALFYNLYAQEKEGGTLSLLLSQPVSLSWVLFSKGLLRFLIVCMLGTALLLLGFVLQGINLFAQADLFFQSLFIVYGYSMLWAILMGGIVALKKRAELSAMLGLGVWLAFTLISPSLLNLFVLAQEPLPNRTEMIHALRSQNDKNWESPKTYALNRFYETHPEYNDGDTLNFDKWYYATFTLLDQEAARLNAGFEAQVAKRNKLLKSWQWLAPAAIVHEKLSQIAGTDRDSHQAFVQEVKDYHQELKAIYYSKIFKEEPFSVQDLEKLNTLLVQ